MNRRDLFKRTGLVLAGMVLAESPLVTGAEAVRRYFSLDQTHLGKPPVWSQPADGLVLDGDGLKRSTLVVPRGVVYDTSYAVYVEYGGVDCFRRLPNVVEGWEPLK